MSQTSMTTRHTKLSAYRQAGLTSVRPTNAGPITAETFA